MKSTGIRMELNRLRLALANVAPLVTTIATTIATAVGMLVISVPTSAQTQLQPPKSVAPSTGNATPLQRGVSIKPQQIVLKRFQNIKMDNKLIDLRSLPDSTLLKGKSGRTISVERIKLLQARIDGTSNAPMMAAKKGQSIKSLAAAPSGTLISLPGGRITRSQDMAKLQTIFARRNEKRVVRPIPISLKNAPAVAVVGQGGLTLANAIKRPAADVIQVGSRKYTAEQLRQMDALLKASPREPRGLVERVGTRAARPVPSVNAPIGTQNMSPPTEPMKSKLNRQGDGK